MSSYRKKHYPPKPEKKDDPIPVYNNPGDDRSIYTGRLTSGLPYQRPVNPKEVERLIREYPILFHHTSSTQKSFIFQMIST